MVRPKTASNHHVVFPHDINHHPPAVLSRSGGLWRSLQRLTLDSSGHRATRTRPIRLFRESNRTNHPNTPATQAASPYPRCDAGTLTGKGTIMQNKPSKPETEHPQDVSVHKTKYMSPTGQTEARHPHTLPAHPSLPGKPPRHPSANNSRQRPTPRERIPPHLTRISR